MGGKEKRGGLVTVRTRGEALQHLDRAIGEVMLERRLERLMESRGEKIALGTVRRRPSHLVADRVRGKPALGEIGEVVGMIDGVVPAFEVGPFEAVRGGLFANTAVPLPKEAQVVPRRPQVLREGELAVREIFEVAHVPLIVGQQLVPKGGGTGEQAGPRRRADRRWGECLGEPGARGGEAIEVRRAHHLVAVTAQRRLGVLVGHEEENVGHTGVARLPGTGWMLIMLGSALPRIA